MDVVDGGLRWSQEWEPIAGCCLRILRVPVVFGEDGKGGVKRRVKREGVLKVPTRRS